jgi:hypothetical protein
MPTKLRRENTFIERFLSAYENHSWADAKIDWLDERIDGAVEAIATRQSDGKTLAIEHTIIQPFVGEKEDFAFFEAAFLKIQQDTTLPVPQRWIRVFIPVGILRGQHQKATRNAIVESIHSWLKKNRLSLADGRSEHPVQIDIPGTRALEITINIKVVPLPGRGRLHVFRQQMENNLETVIDEALKRKLPKLVRTNADKRVLFLERQHMNLYPSDMLSQIEKRKSVYRELSQVDEIWVLETMFYRGDSFLGFERFENDTLIGSFYFEGPQLLDKFENGVFALGPGIGTEEEP